MLPSIDPLKLSFRHSTTLAADHKEISHVKDLQYLLIRQRIAQLY
jgi:hypothetical protein